MILEIVIVPTIAAVVYFIMTLYKQTIAQGRESYIRVIPLISGILGIVLGITAYYITPEIMPTKSLFTAMLIGGASGLSATGTNQIFKQLGKKENEDDKQ
jgi:hypothetical protein